jgi:hypothetical protein
VARGDRRYFQRWLAFARGPLGLATHGLTLSCCPLTRLAANGSGLKYSGSS